MISFPLIEKIPYVDPLEVLVHLPFSGTVFLDSANQDNQGRYSFIACDPFQFISCKNGIITVNKHRFKADPFEVIQKELAKYDLPNLPDLPPFQGGMAGMLGYELGSYLEKLPRAKLDELVFPEMLLGFYDVVIAWDHLFHQSWIFSSGFPEKNPSARLNRAQKRIEWMLKKISKIKKLAPIQVGEIISLTSNFSEKTYQNAVLKVKEYILAGDIFEVNISQRFRADFNTLNPFALYCHLRKINSAPFGCFLQWGSKAILSASPERFLQLRHGHVQSRPIKGTCKRHIDKNEDERLKQALRVSEKDRAENIMIVDLMRNDLSRVCEPHSVHVPQLCGVESFATVHHLVSVVEGILSPGKNALDLIKASFPGGSVTGAPKIRSMEIIAEMEPVLRGPYCGSIGYIGFNGDMDLSITIRTLVVNNQIVTFHAGGAITMDSCPEAEYQETLIKAERLIQSLRADQNEVIFK